MFSPDNYTQLNHFFTLFEKVRRPDGIKQNINRKFKDFTQGNNRRRILLAIYVYIYIVLYIPALVGFSVIQMLVDVYNSFLSLHQHYFGLDQWGQREQHVYILFQFLTWIVTAFSVLYNSSYTCSVQEEFQTHEDKCPVFQTFAIFWFLPFSIFVSYMTRLVMFTSQIMWHRKQVTRKDRTFRQYELFWRRIKLMITSYNHVQLEAQSEFLRPYKYINFGYNRARRQQNIQIHTLPAIYWGVNSFAIFHVGGYLNPWEDQIWEKDLDKSQKDQKYEKYLKIANEYVHIRLKIRFANKVDSKNANVDYKFQKELKVTNERLKLAYTKFLDDLKLDEERAVIFCCCLQYYQRYNREFLPYMYDQKDRQNLQQFLGVDLLNQAYSQTEAQLKSVHLQQQVPLEDDEADFDDTGHERRQRGRIQAQNNTLQQDQSPTKPRLSATITRKFRQSRQTSRNLFLNSKFYQNRRKKVQKDQPPIDQIINIVSGNSKQSEAQELLDSYVKDMQELPDSIPNQNTKVDSPTKQTQMTAQQVLQNFTPFGDNQKVQDYNPSLFTQRQLNVQTENTSFDSLLGELSTKNIQSVGGVLKGNQPQMIGNTQQQGVRQTWQESPLQKQHSIERLGQQQTDQLQSISYSQTFQDAFQQDQSSNMEELLSQKKMLNQISPNSYSQSSQNALLQGENTVYGSDKGYSNTQGSRNYQQNRQGQVRQENLQYGDTNQGNQGQDELQRLSPFQQVGNNIQHLQQLEEVKDFSGFSDNQQSNFRNQYQAPRGLNEGIDNSTDKISLYESHDTTQKINHVQQINLLQNLQQQSLQQHQYNLQTLNQIKGIEYMDVIKKQDIIERPAQHYMPLPQQNIMVVDNSGNQVQDRSDIQYFQQSQQLQLRSRQRHSYNKTQAQSSYSKKPNLHGKPMPICEARVEPQGSPRDDGKDGSHNGRSQTNDREDLERINLDIDPEIRERQQFIRHSRAPNQSKHREGIFQNIMNWFQSTGAPGSQNSGYQQVSRNSYNGYSKGSIGSGYKKGYKKYRIEQQSDELQGILNKNQKELQGYYENSGDIQNSVDLYTQYPPLLKRQKNKFDKKVARQKNAFSPSLGSTNKPTNVIQNPITLGLQRFASQNLNKIFKNDNTSKQLSSQHSSAYDRAVIACLGKFDPHRNKKRHLEKQQKRKGLREKAKEQIMQRLDLFSKNIHEGEYKAWKSSFKYLISTNYKSFFKNKEIQGGIQGYTFYFRSMLYRPNIRIITFFIVVLQVFVSNCLQHKYNQLKGMRLLIDTITLFQPVRFILADVEKEAELFVRDLFLECGVELDTSANKGLENRRKNTSMKLLMVALNVLTHMTDWAGTVGFDERQIWNPYSFLGFVTNMWLQMGKESHDFYVEQIAPTNIDPSPQPSPRDLKPSTRDNAEELLNRVYSEQQAVKQMSYNPQKTLQRAQSKVEQIGLINVDQENVPRNSIGQHINNNSISQWQGRNLSANTLGHQLPKRSNILDAYDYLYLDQMVNQIRRNENEQKLRHMEDLKFDFPRARQLLGGPNEGILGQGRGQSMGLGFGNRGLGTSSSSTSSGGNKESSELYAISDGGFREFELFIQKADQKLETVRHRQVQRQLKRKDTYELKLQKRKSKNLQRLSVTKPKSTPNMKRFQSMQLNQNNKSINIQRRQSVFKWPLRKLSQSPTSSRQLPYRNSIAQNTSSGSLLPLDEPRSELGHESIPTDNRLIKKSNIVRFASSNLNKSPNSLSHTPKRPKSPQVKGILQKKSLSSNIPNRGIRIGGNENKSRPNQNPKSNAALNNNTQPISNLKFGNNSKPVRLINMTILEGDEDYVTPHAKFQENPFTTSQQQFQIQESPFLVLDNVQAKPNENTSKQKLSQEQYLQGQNLDQGLDQNSEPYISTGRVTQSPGRVQQTQSQQDHKVSQQQIKSRTTRNDKNDSGLGETLYSPKSLEQLKVQKELDQQLWGGSPEFGIRKSFNIQYNQQGSQQFNSSISQMSQQSTPPATKNSTQQNLVQVGQQAIASYNEQTLNHDAQQQQVILNQRPQMEYGIKQQAQSPKQQKQHDVQNSKSNINDLNQQDKRSLIPPQEAVSTQRSKVRDRDQISQKSTSQIPNYAHDQQQLSANLVGIQQSIGHIEQELRSKGPEKVRQGSNIQLQGSIANDDPQQKNTESQMPFNSQNNQQQSPSNMSRYATSSYENSFKTVVSNPSIYNTVAGEQNNRQRDNQRPYLVNNEFYQLQQNQIEYLSQSSTPNSKQNRQNTAHDNVIQNNILSYDVSQSIQQELQTENKLASDNQRQNSVLGENQLQDMQELQADNSIDGPSTQKPKFNQPYEQNQQGSRKQSNMPYFIDPVTSRQANESEQKLLNEQTQSNHQRQSKQIIGSHVDLKSKPTPKQSKDFKPHQKKTMVQDELNSIAQNKFQSNLENTNSQQSQDNLHIDVGQKFNNFDRHKNLPQLKYNNLEENQSSKEQMLSISQAQKDLELYSNSGSTQNFLYDTECLQEDPNIRQNRLDQDYWNVNQSMPQINFQQDQDQNIYEQSRELYETQDLLQLEHQTHGSNQVDIKENTQQGRTNVPNAVKEQNQTSSTGQLRYLHDTQQSDISYINLQLSQNTNPMVYAFEEKFENENKEKRSSSMGLDQNNVLQLFGMENMVHYANKKQSQSLVMNQAPRDQSLIKSRSSHSLQIQGSSGQIKGHHSTEQQFNNNI